MSAFPAFSVSPTSSGMANIPCTSAYLAKTAPPDPDWQYVTLLVAREIAPWALIPACECIIYLLFWRKYDSTGKRRYLFGMAGTALFTWMLFSAMSRLLTTIGLVSLDCPRLWRPGHAFHEMACLVARMDSWAALAFTRGGWEHMEMSFPGFACLYLTVSLTMVATIVGAVKAEDQNLCRTCMIQRRRKEGGKRHCRHCNGCDFGCGEVDGEDGKDDKQVEKQEKQDRKRSARLQRLKRRCWECKEMVLTESIHGWQRKEMVGKETIHGYDSKIC